MSDAKSNGAPDDDLIELDVMLGLANRELVFLIDHFGARPELSGTASGGEFLETLEIARLALVRVRHERAAPDNGGPAPHQSIHDAISAMKRETP
jgi:hypothetical protein